MLMVSPQARTQNFESHSSPGVSGPFWKPAYDRLTKLPGILRETHTRFVMAILVTLVGPVSVEGKNISNYSDR